MIAYAASLSSRDGQRGAVLLVSTIILLVLSLLAVALAKNAVLENRMAAAARNAQLAQFAADSAMSEAQAKIARIAAREGAKAVCSALRCAVREADAPVDPAAYLRTPAGLAAANPVRAALADAEGNGAVRPASAPLYVVEDLGAAPSMLGSPATDRHLFRITAKGVGPTEDFARVVEGVYSVGERAVPAG